MNKNIKNAMNYHKKEEQLFARWAERADQLRDSDEITKDGLLYRGEIWFDGYCQVHRPADEEQLWSDAGMRLMVLTRELYDEDGWDLRTETGRVPSPRLTCRTARRFFPNLELWVYGLMNIPDRKAPSFQQAYDEQRLQGFYENAPIVRVNCKKQPADRATTTSAFQHYLDAYADLLTEQVKLYDADVILCTGGQGAIVRFLKQHVYTDLSAVGQCCYFSPSTGVAVVQQYHPTYTVYSAEEMYNRMMSDYQHLLDTTPQFQRRR